MKNITLCLFALLSITVSAQSKKMPKCDSVDYYKMLTQAYWEYDQNDKKLLKAEHNRLTAANKQISVKALTAQNLGQQMKKVKADLVLAIQQLNASNTQAETLQNTINKITETLSKHKKKAALKLISAIK